VDLDTVGTGPHVLGPAEAAVILLDTHAAIWLGTGHRRSRPLARMQRLYLSPVSVLELQFLVEAGRLRLAAGRAASELQDDDRWRLDEPPAAKLFTRACELSWTRDPFDRLLAAHALVRGWKLATADGYLLEHLPSSSVMPL
jgi:PIN domain nuclease of toxin-antitoxin system